MAEDKKEAVWNTYSEAEKKALQTLCDGYRDFLTTCKTERESTREAVQQAEAAGYRNLTEMI